MDSKPIARRVLILTSSTGSGHDARAYAMRDWFQKLYGEAVDVKVEHFLENASSTGNFGVDFYNFIQRYAPFVHYIYWFIIEIVGQLARWNILVGKKYFEGLIRDFKPHLIISVHDFLNLGYFELARKILGKDHVKCVTYCGEFSGGFGFSINWVNSSSDWYISRTAMAQKFALKLGAPKERSSVYLGLFAPRVHEDRLQEDGKKDYRQNELGLDREKFTVFLTTGGNGANNHLPLLNVLYKYKKSVQAVVVCGRSQSTFQRVSKWKQEHSDFELFLEGHSSRVRQLIQASDIVIAKGGGNTAAKCLFLGTPIIFNRLNGMMPQEKVTVKFFKKNNATRIFSSIKQFDRLIEAWKDKGSDYQALLKNFRDLKEAEPTPEAFFGKLMSFANEAANEAKSRVYFHNFS